MKSYDFIIDLDPSEHTHQAGTHYYAFGKKVKSYKDAELKKAETLLRVKLHPHAPEEKLEGAVKLRVDFYKHQKSMDGKKLKHDVWKTTKPDCDNWSKTLVDIVKRYWLHDDAQIVHETITKHATPGDGYIRIYIGEIEE